MAKMKCRADQLVCEQGLAETRERAKRLIMAGLVRFVADGRETPVDKPGRMFSPETVFAVDQGERYVSRGGGKLETAVEAFGLDVAGKTALDAGASTGGFTDCLLQHGAARVYAVDVGTAQLHEKLRADPRVVSMENVNLRHAPPDLLPEPVDVVVADVSFISLTKVLPACVRFLRPGGLVVALVKPQFELTPEKVGKGGVVREEAFRLEAVERVTAFARDELGLAPVGVVPSKVKGPKGNQEYLAVFAASAPECGSAQPRKGDAVMPMSVKEAIAARHSVRAFAKTPLTGDEIAELLDAARNAPSSLNSQPWRFKVVTGAGDLAWFATGEASRGQRWLAGAAAVIVCCVDMEHYVKDSQSAAFFYRDNKIIEGETMDGIEAYVAREAAGAESARFGACAMNMAIAESFLMLRAVEMGLGTCWVGMFDEARVRARFGLPDGVRIVNILAVGRPDEAVVPPRRRKSLDEIVIE